MLWSVFLLVLRVPVSHQHLHSLHGNKLDWIDTLTRGVHWSQFVVFYSFGIRPTLLWVLSHQTFVTTAINTLIVIIMITQYGSMAASPWRHDVTAKLSQCRCKTVRGWLAVFRSFIFSGLTTSLHLHESFPPIAASSPTQTELSLQTLGSIVLIFAPSRRSMHLAGN